MDYSPAPAPLFLSNEDFERLSLLERLDYLKRLKEHLSNGFLEAELLVQKVKNGG